MKRTYKRSFDQLEQIVADTGRFFDEQNIDGSLRMKVDLSVEELFVNMVTYNSETDRDIQLEMRPVAGGIDPTSVPDVDVDAPLSERTPGGLGLYLVLKMADSIHYEYQGRTSKITFRNIIRSEGVVNDV